MPDNTDKNDPEEMLAVVNADDVEIGAETRKIIHQKAMLHRAVHVLVFNPANSLLIQQRSALKDLYPLHWECVGGHVDPGETYEAAAVRELNEELDIACNRMEFLTKIPASATTGWEFIHAYRCVTAAPPRPETSEVIAVKWVTLDQLRDEIKAGGRTFSPVFIHTLECARIIKA